MMSVAGLPVELVLDTGDDGDAEYTEQQLQSLLAEVSRLDLVSIERVPSPLPPPRSRSTGAPPRSRSVGVQPRSSSPAALELGTLVIALGGTGALLPVLVGVVRDWLNRRRSASLRIKIGDDEIELTPASDDMQQRALEEFLRRHGE